MDPIIFHIDVNSAFLSWSALKALQEGSDVDLREIPSIVGGDQETRHGIVVAKSVPAKKYGIQTAETVVSAFQKCPSLVTVQPDHKYYQARSRELMEYLASVCPAIEQVSIDECYMDFEPIRSQFASPEEAAYFIKDSVYDRFGFTVNVGISNRKILAKMASDFQKPNRVHTLYDYEIRKKMWPLPISELHMCGKSSASLLQTMGIHTIGDLAAMDKQMVESWLKSHGTLLWNFANGIDESAVHPEPSKTKGIGNSTTLSTDAADRETACKVLQELCKSVSSRLKKHSFTASSVCVEIKYASFESVSHQMTLKAPTNQYQQLYACSLQLFDELWNQEPIRLLGVRTTKLADLSEPVQMDLFSYQEEMVRAEKQKKLDDAMGAIRKKYGLNAIKKGEI